MIKKVSILGAGESGTGTAILAQKMGFEVFVSDYGTIKPNYKSELNSLGIKWEEGKHTEEKIMASSIVVKSPGIPNSATIIKSIAQANIPIISEMEFAQPFSTAKVIGITGTNGKTTTTSLIHHVLVQNGINAKVGGNIGKSYARQIAEGDAEYFVLELSSFQLDESTNFICHIAVLLNITPDHLDRYDNDISKYAASKFKIIQNHTQENALIYCADDTLIQQYWPKNVNSTLYPFTTKNYVKKGAYSINGAITIMTEKNKIDIHMKNTTLKGTHNTYNSMAAGVVASLLNLKNENVKESFSNFSTIEHRLEFVGKIQGVSYINDSKATNVNSAWYALESMNTSTIWIAGGIDKGNEYADLKPLVKEKVRLIICLGLDNSKLHNAFQGDVDMMINVSSAEEAVHVASHLAQQGETVLLSPACASFDLFENYEDRGRKFKKAVFNL